VLPQLNKIRYILIPSFRPEQTDGAILIKSFALTLRHFAAQATPEKGHGLPIRFNRERSAPGFALVFVLAGTSRKNPATVS
jgi:hypothetical protein